MKTKLRMKRLSKLIPPVLLALMLTVILVAAAPLKPSSSLPGLANANAAEVVQTTGSSSLTVTGAFTAKTIPLASNVYRRAVPASAVAPTQTAKATTVPTPASPVVAIDKIAQVSTVLSIYQKGQALGNNPKSFSKVGDCNSVLPYFLSYFDLGAWAYDLGGYSNLQPVIDQFKGSFQRDSIAVGDGFNTSTVLSAMWANPNLCRVGESPLACEYRINKPSFSIISLGTDDFLTPAKFEANLRTILDQTINLGIVPILLTKMENANLMNYNPIIIKLAKEYNIPLVDMWTPLQSLPGKGLSDNIHPTGPTAGFIFTPVNLSYFGWTVRNLTVLQALDTTWRQAAIR
jgi:hypothetical protein